MNKWNIPLNVEMAVIARDKRCVYCGVEFNSCGSRKSKSSWEHITNDIRIAIIENIALCCISCNASKGAKSLSDWMHSKYCFQKGITPDSVADVIKAALINPPKFED